MKRTVRIAAMLMVLILAVSLLSSVALAAGYKNINRSCCAKVTTETPPWYAILARPKLTLKNTGSSSMSVYIENDKGQIISTLTNLKAGKTHTFTLPRKGSTYTFVCAGNAMSGSLAAYGEVSGNGYVKSIK